MRFGCFVRRFNRTVNWEDRGWEVKGKTGLERGDVFQSKLFLPLILSLLAKNLMTPLFRVELINSI